ncbi:MAG TPA: hypothetical protein VF208_04860 [Candidatus Binatia bacterium]
MDRVTEMEKRDLITLSSGKLAKIFLVEAKDLTGLAFKSVLQEWEQCW